MSNILVFLSGLFYGLLCIFSIVTGLIYMLHKRELNPLELPDSFYNKLKSNPSKLNKFAFFAGLLTFVVGIVQGLTSYSIIFHTNYYLALGFTIFSICSATSKIIGKINIFPILKVIAYVAIAIILILNKSLF